MKVRTETYGTIEANEQMLELLATALYEASKGFIDDNANRLSALCKQTSRDIMDELERAGWYN